MKETLESGFWWILEWLIFFIIFWVILIIINGGEIPPNYIGGLLGLITTIIVELERRQ